MRAPTIVTRLQGASCLVSGGTGAIGAAIVARLRAEGAQVIAADIGVVAEAESDELLRLDVTEAASWSRAVGATIDRFGGLDIVVNAAGIFGDLASAQIPEFDLIAYRRVQHVNAEGTLLGCIEALKVMKPARRGAILNLASISGVIPTAYALAYGVSKAATIHLTRSIAAEGAPFGIRCNAVLPGPIDTGEGGMMATSIARVVAKGDAASLEQANAASIARVPLGRMGTPAEVAAAAAFLVSSDASYITGSMLPVAGGLGG